MELVKDVLMRIQDAAAAAFQRRSLIVVAVVALMVAVAGCGGGETPTPTPTATPAPTSAPASTDVALEEETLPASVDTPAAPVGVLATPTVTVLTVDENEGGCSMEYDMDLAGYPDLYLRMGCPLDESTYDPVAINEFGGGPDYDRFMLWFSSEQQIYVLFPEQTWQSYRDTWDESQPELSCNPLNAPPTSPPLPRRGFGKLWCSVDTLQQQLGLTDREERLCQHAVVQTFERGRMLACFEDATIRYFSLLNDGTWQLLIVQ